MSDFSALSLSAPVLRAIEDLGFTAPTIIQSATIPSLMAGNDVIGVAQTGGGKTAAFVVPMLERLALQEEKVKPGMPRALILAPTRELVLQINDAIRDLSRHMNLKTCAIYGGAPYRTQIHILRRGVDILVATPGRLMDHMKQGNIHLDEIEYFVLDEADRMLDMGFVDDVKKISASIRREHQSVLFSATLNHQIGALAASLLKEPDHIEVSPQASITDRLTHKVLHTPRDKKHDLLLHMIEDRNVFKALVFVRTKREADELADVLKANGHRTESIHGDKQQRQRSRIIQSFRDDKIAFLVATDVAARGIDVQDISHVFNIDVPVEAESYVHRIGRTARGTASGTAYTFCSKSEYGLLRAIERLIKMSIEVDHDNPFPMPTAKKSPYRAEARPGKRSDSNWKSDRKPRQDKPFGEKKWADGDKPRQGKPFGEKKWADGDKPRQGKPFGEKKWADGDKPRQGKPFGEKKWADGDKPRQGKPFGEKKWADGDKPRQDKPFGEKKWADGDKPRPGKPAGAKRTEGGKPGFKKSLPVKAKGKMAGTGKPFKKRAA